MPAHRQSFPGYLDTIGALSPGEFFDLAAEGRIGHDQLRWVRQFEIGRFEPPATRWCQAMRIPPVR